MALRSYSPNFSLEVIYRGMHDWKRAQRCESLQIPMMASYSSPSMLTLIVILGSTLASILLLNKYSGMSSVFRPGLEQDHFETMMSCIFWWQLTYIFTILSWKTTENINVHFLVFLLHKLVGWAVNIVYTFYSAFGKHRGLPLYLYLKIRDRKRWLAIADVMVFSIILSILRFLGSDLRNIAFFHAHFALIVDIFNFWSSLRFFLKTSRDGLGIACLVIFGGHMVSNLGSLGRCMLGIDVTWPSFTNLITVLQFIASTIALSLLVKFKIRSLVEILLFQFYRIKTFQRSLKSLCTLPPEKIDTVLHADNIFDQNWANEDELIKKMGKDYYKEIQKKLGDYYYVLNYLCALGEFEKM